MITKIGLFGGAFDPPTIGHLKLADHLLKNNILDKVWLLPCFKSYYNKSMEDPNIRLEMCIKSVKDYNNENIEVSDFEIKNKITGATHEVLDQLLGYYKDSDCQFYFIIGMDNANNIHKWVNYEDVLEKIPFIVIPRMGYGSTDIKNWYQKDPHIFIDDYSPNEISSTNVRSWYKETKSSSHPHITESVGEMIGDFELYT